MSNNQPNEDYVLPPGTMLNNGCYRIVRKLGQGGFGITYLAMELGHMQDIGEGRKRFRKTEPEEVVIKELFYEEFCHRENITQLVTISKMDKKVEFEKLVNKQVEEGLILGTLEHDNIVVNRNIFKENNTAYIVMDYLAGADLEEILKKEKRLSQGMALKYISQVLQALSYIHSRKIMHLDIKPSNIYIRKKRKVEKEDGSFDHIADDSAVLIDFGASLTYDSDNKVNNTTSKLISGISSYAPLEQSLLDNLKGFDPRLDIFSTTGTLYSCITGQMPVSPSLRVSADDDPLILPTWFKGNELLDKQIDEICRKGLSLKARDRYASAADMLAALGAVSGSGEITKLVAAKKGDDNQEKQAQYNELLYKAQKLADLGRYPDALATIKDALRHYPDEIYGNKVLGDIEKKIVQKPVVPPPPPKPVIKPPVVPPPPMKRVVIPPPVIKARTSTPKELAIVFGVIAVIVIISIIVLYAVFSKHQDYNSYSPTDSARTADSSKMAVDTSRKMTDTTAKMQPADTTRKVSDYSTPQTDTAVKPADTAQAQKLD